jgi:exo-1,4-beta-D-glucosaminidase
MRAMFESFRARQFDATGEIQWMLNNAWPSMIWHLYDYYLRPGGAYFATKLACEPLHILYMYDDRSIRIVNDSLKAMDNLTAIAEIYDIDAKLKHRQSTACTAPANAATVAFTLPSPGDISPTYFLRLALQDADHRPVSVNSYWLSTKPDVLNFKKSDWNFTPCTSFADYTALEKLAKVKLSAEQLGVEHIGAEDQIRVRVGNDSAAIAMLVRLKVSRGPKGDEVLPIRWQDNYFMLLPNEKREITARYLSRDLQGAVPVVSVGCFNNR